MEADVSLHDGQKRFSACVNLAAVVYQHGHYWKLMVRCRPERSYGANVTHNGPREVDIHQDIRPGMC
jgi:hypothetical protein